MIVVATISFYLSLSSKSGWQSVGFIAHKHDGAPTVPLPEPAKDGDSQLHYIFAL